MTDIEPENNKRDQEQIWEESVRKKERRKIRARRQRSHSVWFGFGMFGMVGWSIAVPTLLGIFIGLWIDRNWPGQTSWTLMLMFAGLVIGCYNAWNWITKESGANKRKEEKEQHEDQ